MAPWVVIHNGIASAFLDAPPPRPDPKKAGAVMRLSAIKNPPALGRIAARLTQSDVTLELVTDASRIRAFPQLAAQVALRPPIADSADLAVFYGGCRAIVCPSHFEASGNVPLEALATGTPAVVTTGMGSAELVRALGRDDLIVEVDDVEGMVDRVMRAEPVAPAIRARLRDELSWPSVCARLISALSQ
jgi:glycosyltransferase involved in cell wall biosynthesis